MCVTVKMSHEIFWHFSKFATEKLPVVVQSLWSSLTLGWLMSSAQHTICQGQHYTSSVNQCLCCTMRGSVSHQVFVHVESCLICRSVDSFVLTNMVFSSRHCDYRRLVLADLIQCEYQTQNWWWLRSPGVVCLQFCWLSPLASDATSKLDVLGHDGDSFGVDGCQIGVLK